MIVQSLSFYLFATLLLASGVMVISARNPVHSVLFLILAFFQAAGLCVLMGAEFLAMILVIVYVGAVAVLFLFVVMMLDINLKDLRAGFLQYLPIGGLVGLVLLLELVMVLGPSLISHSALETAAKAKAVAPAVTNTEALGQLVYTHYVYLFQASGIVLLIAMIGAIVLTLRQREGVRKQNVSAQLARRRDETVTIRKVSTGGGI
ncbi:NADH-quinone oxidoreductase subunit J [Azospirillum fermentarium]|uniref:NADH-quinone oxidoreductase subunit J n=1 Tax=Azospirillum fermentarium TaxID=1233114 RepID=UPI0022277444|nr:NADH-quinone oxidoreductase subunit J [Azospirillum fermentarium]